MSAQELHLVAPDYFVSSPAALHATHFASGSSALGDLRGFARILYPIGVSVPHLSERALDELLGMAHLPIDIFVDSGAFSEREFGPAGPVTIALISDEAWSGRLSIMYRIASAFGSKARLVAPDCVGDQAETLRRLSLFADVVRALRALGSRIVLPIQRGTLAPEAFDRACSEALGFDDAVRAIPGNKEAMPSDEVRSLVRAVRPRAVHLLGIGPRGPRFAELDHSIRSIVPEVELSCDSNLIAANTGRSNGRGGGPRALTQAGDDLGRENAIVAVFGGAAIVRRTLLAGLLGSPRNFRGLGGFSVEFGPKDPRQIELF